MPFTTPLRRGAHTRERLTPLLALALAACASPASETAVPPRAVRVSTARVEEPNAGTAYAGSLAPRVRLDLAFGVAGRVKALGTIRDGGVDRVLREGDLVKKGTVLALLDDVDLARSASVAGLTTAAASSEIAAAEAALKQLESDLERAKKLAAAGAIGGAERDTLESAVKVARAKLEAARSQRAARSEQSAIARKAAADAKLVAPADGVIARRMIDPGESVTPITVAFSLVDTTELELEVAIPDVRISTLRLGDTIPVRSAAVPGSSFSGRVRAIHPVADPMLRTFTVEIAVPNDDGRLRAGMIASAVLGSRAEARLLLVPLASVVRGPEGGLAVFVLAGDSVSARTITAGDLVGSDVVVEQGIALGDRVVTDGAALLHDGEQVRVRP